jgi:hypothetical protein
MDIDGVRLLASLTFEGHGPAILPATAVPTWLFDRCHVVAVDGLPPRRVGVAQRRLGLPAAPARALLALCRDVVADAANRPPGVYPAG